MLDDDLLRGAVRLGTLLCVIGLLGGCSGDAGDPPPRRPDGRDTEDAVVDVATSDVLRTDIVGRDAPDDIASVPDTRDSYTRVDTWDGGDALLRRDAGDAPLPDAAADARRDADGGPPADADTGDAPPDVPDPPPGCVDDAACAARFPNLPPCHVARCDVATGACLEATAPDGAACDDGDPCTLEESCVAGACVGRPRICDDGDFCNGLESCAPGEGCVDGAPPDCDDDDPCTEDSCDPFLGCSHAPVEGGCDDGDGCTVDDRCVAGVCVPGRSVCACPGEDDGEEDDTPAVARPLALDVPVAGYACPFDMDWYRIVPASAGVLVVEAQVGDAPCGLDLDVYDAAAVRLASGGRNGDALRAVTEVEAGATVFVRLLTSAGDGVGYELDATVRTGGACLDDRFEENDGVADAWPVTPGETVAGSLCAGDDDWFAVPVDAAGRRLRALLSHEAGAGDLSLSLVAPDGGEVVGSVETDGAAEVAHLTAASGDYGVLVSGAVGEDEAAYTLWIAPLDDACVDDDGEPDDDPSAARRVEDGARVDRVLCADDEDWFEIAVTGPAELTVEVEPTDPTAGIAVDIHDQEGALLAAGREEERVTRARYETLSDRTVRVRVSAAPGVQAAYVLRVDVTAWTCEPDRHEPNDDVAAATAVVPPAAVGATICGGESDWFRFPVGAGDRVSLALRFDTAGEPLRLYLSGENGQTLVVGEETAEGEAIRWEADRDRVVTVRAFGLLGASNRYVLDIAVQDAATICDDDPFEENDAHAAARGIESAVPLALVACPGDEDWFAFPLQAGDTAVIDIAHDAADGPLALGVVRSDGARLASESVERAGQRQVFQAAADGVYRIVVAAAAGEGPHPYSLTATRLPAGSGGCLDDAYEEDDDPVAAAPVPADGVVLGQICPADADWYVVDTPGRTVVHAELAHAPERGPLVAGLFDTAGVLAAETSGEAVDEIAVTALQTGPVLLRVSGADDVANAYVLTVTAEPWTCVDDDLEENDTQATAPDVTPAPTPGGTAERQLAGVLCQDDNDWYALELAAGQRVAVDLRFAHDVGDLNLYLVRDNGQALVVGRSRDDDETVRYTATYTGSHAIRVFGILGASNVYTLAIRVEEPPDDGG